MQPFFGYGLHLSIIPITYWSGIVWAQRSNKSNVSQFPIHNVYCLLTLDLDVYYALQDVVTILHPCLKDVL